MSEPIRILIADDHPILRDGLRRLVESEPGMAVVGEASDGDEAVRLVAELKPDILLLDLFMPRQPGLMALRGIAESALNVRTIILTAAIDRAQVLEAVQLGARGIVLKEAATQLLLRCIRSVMAGELWIGREAVSDLVLHLQTCPPATEPPKKFGLTRRELEVVGKIVAGCTNKDIARELAISEETVKHHLSNTFDKLGVSNRLELALFAVNHRLT